MWRQEISARLARRRAEASGRKMVERMTRMSTAAGNLATAEMGGTTETVASARAVAAMEIRHRPRLAAAGTGTGTGTALGNEIVSAVGRMTTVVRSVGRVMEEARPVAREAAEVGVIRVRPDASAPGAVEGRHQYAVAAVDQKEAVVGPRWIATEATEIEESEENEIHAVVATGVMARTATATAREEAAMGTEIPKAVLLRGGLAVAMRGPTVGLAASGMMRATARCA